MKNWTDIGKKIQMIAFLLIIIVFGFMSKPYNVFIQMAFYPYFNEEEESKTLTETIQYVISSYNDAIWQRVNFINLAGVVEDKLNMDALYNNKGIYVDKDKYIMSGAAKTSTDYEIEQMVALKEYLDEKKIDLLYVNALTKYVDDSIFAENFGVESYCNRNADKFLSRLQENNIDYIDLRTYLEEGIDIKDMFYRTDHHWTTTSGLWACGVIADTLNERYNYSIDTSLFDKSNYMMKKMENCWLGEQGFMMSETYTGLDDFTWIRPNFETDIILSLANQGEYPGTFDMLVNSELYDIDIREYNYPSFHYSYFYMGLSGSNIHNNKVDDGKILLVGDSYSQVVSPFLSLGVSDLSTIVMRSYGGDLQDYIEANDFDTVIILYAPWMIGSHDDPESANYRMFDFVDLEGK